MIVDDRLETVLRTRAAGKTAARTQLRQLIDLLGAIPLAAWNSQHAAALQRVEALEMLLSDDECAAVLRAAPHRSPVLVYHFAQSGPRSASAAVAAARLTDEDWLALIPRLPTAARGFVRHRSDLGEGVRALLSRLGVSDFLLPEPVRAPVPEPAAQAMPDRPAFIAPIAVPDPAPAPEPEPALSTFAADDGIGAIVRRIEAFRRKREERDADARDALQKASPGGIAPRLPFADEPDPARPAPLSIDVRCDAQGSVVHAALDTPGMLLGSRLFCTDPRAPVHCDDTMAQAFRHRQPIAAGQIRIEGAPAVAGMWQADGTPLFTPDGGRFAGYLLRLRRPLAAAAGTGPASGRRPQPALAAEADRLRQLLHELRTPINAIQGFAEMIQSQVHGTTPHQYRAMAASIAADTAHILAGFEEVERLVKLESRALALEPGEADATGVIGRLVDQLSPVLAARNVRLALHLPGEPVAVAMATEELERSVWRVLSVIAASIAPGERLSLSLQSAAGDAHFAMSLPAALYRLDDAALFAPDASGTAGSLTAPAMLGNGFALRLARAEFVAAAGALHREGERLLITLPGSGASPRAAEAA